MESSLEARHARQATADHPLRDALAAQSKLWHEPRIDVGALGPGWVTAAALFGDDAALDDLLEYQATFTRGLDQKGRAAFLVANYSYTFAITAAPLFVGFALVPDFSPSNYALRFDTRPIKHDGRTVEERQARVRFLSAAFSTDKQSNATHPDAKTLLDRAGLRALFRQSIEDHFRPLIERLHRKSGLSRNALWRLAGDSLAALFLDAGERFQRDVDAQADAMAILKQPGSPLNNRQMHYFDVAVRDDERPERALASRTFRARGGCCRYYTAEGGKLCSTCVLKDPVERDQELMNAMRSGLSLQVAEVDVAAPASP
jgi:ferric iron reductase protein FhuF